MKIEMDMYDASISSPLGTSQTAADKTVSQILGEITWLLTQSPVHKQLFVGDLEWFCLPPILHRTFRIFYGQQSPAAVVFFARVSADTDARLRAGGYKLRSEEWVGGDVPWLVELVAPFGGQDEIMVDMSKHIFADQPFNYHRLTAEGVREAVEWKPAGQEL